MTERYEFPMAKAQWTGNQGPCGCMVVDGERCRQRGYPKWCWFTVTCREVFYGIRDDEEPENDTK